MRERVKAIIFFLAVASVAGYFVYREATRVGQPGIINIGQQAPDFSLKDVNGKTMKLSDLRGKAVFLNFWATWCTPCLEEMPEMELVYRKLKDRKFEMIAVSVDNDWDVVKEFYQRYKLTLPSFLDPGHQVASEYKVNKFPETFLIDANGYVVKHTWVERWASQRNMAILEDLVRQADANQEAAKH